jgi:homoserine dehydrogenase
LVTRVALLGYGTVGSAVARRLLTDPPAFPGIALTHIFDRRAEQKAAACRFDRPPRWTSRLDDVLGSDADIVIEAIGGVAPAVEWIRAALAAGKSVVTANKQVIARHGAALWQLAARQGRQIRFEAAVGGAMPIVRAIAEGLAGDRLLRMAAILNGTTNDVLSRIESTGCSLAEALASARAAGYAEVDPSADLNGDDARAKLAILCALAFSVRVEPEAIAARSIEGVEPAAFEAARRQGTVIRQIAFAEFDHRQRVLSACVAPLCVPADSIFGRAAGPQNAALIEGEHSGEVGIFGAGAGGAATAVAILGDVAAIARDRAAIVPPPSLTTDFSLRVPGFLRLSSPRLARLDLRASAVHRATSCASDRPQTFQLLESA